MANGKEIDRFELPRPDWYDEEGRINKTALIANFNAIEAKFNEIASLDVFGIITPDWNSISIPDTTLDSEDTSIINLKSFIDIMDLKNYPLSIKFNGTKLILLSYYDENYKLVNIRNIELQNLDEKENKFIVLDLLEKTVSTTNDLSNLADKVLIGVYFDGIILHPEGMNICDINILEPLANMTTKYKTLDATITGAPVRYADGTRAWGYTKRNNDTVYFKATFEDKGF